MTARSLVGVLCWVLLAGPSPPVGWRGDGSAVFEGATPPTKLPEPTWSTPLGGPGNASPVVAGDLVVVTAEPTRLIAVDRSTGEIRWKHDHPVLDALPEAMATKVAPDLANVEALDTRHAELRKRYALLLREARRGAPEATPAAIAALDGQISSLKAKLDALAPYRTPATGDGIGYASPSPTFDGEHLYALFGNGVAASYTLDGTLRWRRWLGVSPAQKHGYTGVDAASPVRIGEVVVFPHGALHALDPATGKPRWTGPPYPHYGTPTPIDIAGEPFVITPNGEVLRARDGRPQPAKLDAIFYCAPVASGQTVYFAGSDAGWDSTDPVHASAWALRMEEGEVQATRLWQTTLPSRDRVYAQSTLYGDHLLVVSRFKRLVALNRRTGEIVHERALSDRTGEVWANPTVAGDRLYVPTIQGEIYTLQARPPFAEVHLPQSLPANRSTPWFQGTSLYWRGADQLHRFDADLAEAAGQRRP